MAGVVVLLAAGVGTWLLTAGDDDASEPELVDGLPSDAELEAGLLDVSDFPRGWAEVEDDEDGDGSFCDFTVAELLGFDAGALPGATRTVAEDPEEGPVVYLLAGFVPQGRGAEAFELLEDALADCDADELDGVQYEVSRLSFDAVEGADETTAWRIALTNEDAFPSTASLDVVYTRVGDLFVGIGALDTSGASSALVADYAPLAVERAVEVLLDEE